MQIHKMIETSHVCHECPIRGFDLVSDPKSTDYFVWIRSVGVNDIVLTQREGMWMAEHYRTDIAADSSDSMILVGDFEGDFDSVIQWCLDATAVVLRAKLSAEGADGDEIDDAIEALFA